jgi:hypothetical protein
MESEEKESMVLLPEDYKKPDSPYSVMKVVHDPEGQYKCDIRVVVPTHIIREIEVGTETFYLIERGHVMATVH